MVLSLRLTETFCPMIMRVQKVLTINGSMLGMRVVFTHGPVGPYKGNKDMPIQHNHQGKLVLVVEDDADMRSLLWDASHVNTCNGCLPSSLPHTNHVRPG